MRVLGGAQSAADLGHDLGASLTEAEVCYLIDQEWARTAEDVAWRRSKLGLRMTPGEISALEDWMWRYCNAHVGSAGRHAGQTPAA
jgi:glycerol-3-phosphate dehydrogenase